MPKRDTNRPLGPVWLSGNTTAIHHHQEPYELLFSMQIAVFLSPMLHTASWGGKPDVCEQALLPGRGGGGWPQPNAEIVSVTPTVQPAYKHRPQQSSVSATLGDY